MKCALLIFYTAFLITPPALSAQGIAAALPDAPAPQSSSSSPAQTTQPAPAGNPASINSQSASGPPQQRSPSATESAADQLKAEKKQRLLGIVPEFNTVNSGSALPLTSRQKFDLWYHSSIDPFSFAVAGIDAGIEQAEDSYPGYHQGFEGFAKRYGASYADGVDGNFWGNAVLPALLHQDPRYFRLGHGSFKKRLWYAAVSTVRCKEDDGKWAPNYSNVAGNLIGGAISNIYYPASDRGVGLIFERGFTVTAEGAFGSLAYEFYPDAIAYLQRRHQRKLGMLTPTAAGPATAPVPQP